ncbi:hypothetical protein [Streptosporangium lutulentum]|uniref:Uncharacterized protein n=1 Tax=Streptosporangium lutulentum TaxID=1461250 RepID=A0ABT9QDN8_9ACTN|nr:hypothetical protein [Streptosporangium lutulentum]MDP9844059.1 hypothetical protein [Streptosporangium lutulentum]
MTDLLARLGDRVLEKLAPKATAKADTSYYEACYCRERTKYRKLCHVVGGRSSCGPCANPTLC